MQSCIDAKLLRLSGGSIAPKFPQAGVRTATASDLEPPAYVLPPKIVSRPPGALLWCKCDGAMGLGSPD